MCDPEPTDALSQIEDDSKRAIFSACWNWCERMLGSFSPRPWWRWRCGWFLCFTFPRSWTIRGSMPISPKTGCSMASTALPDSGHVMPTFSRLPGYPGFLAAVFAIFGWSNFRAVLLIQVLFDLGTCFLIADLARRFALRARSEGSVPARRALSVPGELLRPQLSPRHWKSSSQRLTLDLALRGIDAFLRDLESQLQRRYR